MQTGRWIARGLLRLSADARAVLPPIMGGTARDVPYSASVESRAALLRSAERSISRRDLGAMSDMRSLGFAPDDIVAPVGVGDDGPMLMDELAPVESAARRDAMGRFVKRAPAPPRSPVPPFTPVAPLQPPRQKGLVPPDEAEVVEEVQLMIG